MRGSCVTSPAGSRAARGEANFLPRHTEVAQKTHRTAIAYAVRCVASCSALHPPSHRTAFLASYRRIVCACTMPALGQSSSILIPEFSNQNQIAVDGFPLFAPLLNSKFSIQHQMAVGRFPRLDSIPDSEFSNQNYTLLCCLVRRARVALRTASTVTPTSPKTASPMLPSPAAASSRMATFTPMAKMMF